MDEQAYETFPLHALCELGNLKEVKKLLGQSKSCVDIILKQDNYRNTALHVAVGSGNDKVLDELISRLDGAPVDIPNVDGDTPLHLAMKLYKKDDDSGDDISCCDCIIRSLLDAGADLNRRNAHRETPMLLASRQESGLIDELIHFLHRRLPGQLLVTLSQEDIAEKLKPAILHYVVKNSDDPLSLLDDVLDCYIEKARSSILEVYVYEGETAIHTVVRKGHFKVFRCLLQKLDAPDIMPREDRRAVDVLNKDGRTALHLAMHLRRLKMAIFLIVYGASPFFQDPDGNTPADVLNGISGAQHFKEDMNSRTAALHFLISVKNEDLQSGDMVEKEKKENILRDLFDLDKTLKENILMHHNSTLEVAVKANNPDILQLLLLHSQTASTEISEEILNPLLEICLAKCSDDTRARMIGLLLEHGLAPQLVSLPDDVVRGDSALLQMVLEKLIAKEGTRSNLKAADQNISLVILVAALHVACRAGNEVMVQHLLESNKGLSKHPLKDETVVHAAVRGGKHTILRMVLGDGANARTTNKLGQTPFHFALATGDLNMLRILDGDESLVRYGTDKTGAGNSHFAARSENATSLEFLHSKTMLQMDARTKSGLTPLHYAAWNGNVKVVHWLLLHMQNPELLRSRDNVEHAMPWEWAAMGIQRANQFPVDRFGVQLPPGQMPLQWPVRMSTEVNPHGSVHALYELITCHAKYTISMFEDDHPWQRVFHRIKDHEADFEMKLVSNFIFMNFFCHAHKQPQSKRQAGHFACLVAHGDKFMNEVLVEALRKEARNDKEAVMKLIRNSRLLEWAAWRATDDANLQNVIPIIKLVDLDPESLDTQLKLTFKYAFTERKAFFEELAECCRHTGLCGVMIKEVVKQEATDATDLKIVDLLHNLPRADHIFFKGNKQMLEDDVPVAYWLALLATYSKTPIKNSMVNPLEKESKVPNNFDIMSLEENDQMEKLVKRVDEYAQRFIPGYPNDKGRHTGRRALHWAAISGSSGEVILRAMREKNVDVNNDDGQIAKKILLNAWQNCKPDVYDDHGKPPCWYARSNPKLLKFLQWDGFMDNIKNDRDLYIDALNALLVGAALISSVTFVGFLQPPLGFSSTFNNSSNSNSNAVIEDDGLKYVSMSVESVRIFWVCNCLSFSFGIASALVGVAGILPSPDEFNYNVVINLRYALLAAGILLVASISFALGAFAGAAFSSLPVGKFEAFTISTIAIGGSICSGVLVWVLRVLFYFFPYSALLKRLTKDAFIKMLQKLKPKEKQSEPEDQKPLHELLKEVEPRTRRRYARTGSAPWEDGLDELLQYSDELRVVVRDPLGSS